MKVLLWKGVRVNISKVGKASQQVHISNQFISRSCRMKVFILILICCHLTLAYPIYFERTVEIPSLMEMVARKIGFVKFMTNFIRGIKATFLDTFFKKEKK